MIAPELAIRELCTFKRWTVEYGMDMLRVKEIRSFKAPTRLAGHRLHGDRVDIEQLITNVGMGLVTQDAD